MVRTLMVCLAVLSLPSFALAQTRVATPTFSVGGGEYAMVVMVKVQVATPGATIRFTQNGLDPTEFDPVIVSGSTLAINTSQTLKARAWKTGLRPSEVRSATYRMMSSVAGPPLGPGDATAGRVQTAIVRPDGRVLAWDTETPPMLVAPLPPATSVEAGGGHTLALTDIGHVYAWGANGFGQLGDGTLTRARSPVHVAGLANVVSISAGRAHSLALTADGLVFAWGSNRRGQLGLASLTDTLSPTLIVGLSDVIAIEAGHAHSVALTATGEVWAWGANENGQLGDGSRTDRRFPRRIAIDDVAAVAAGGDHTLALKRDGTVYSWGLGARGQLGNGSTRTSLRPARIDGMLALLVTAGGDFSAAIQRDGALVTWGANESGQLGDGTILDRPTPGVVSALTGLSTLSLGDRHAIAVTSSGDVWTWGGAALPSKILAGLSDWGPAIGIPATLSAPVVQPPSAAYPAPQTVIITGAANATVRYTLDGSDPTTTSTAYTVPFIVSTTLTVKARAFSTDGVTSSAVVSQLYTIDTSPPSISVEVSPPITRDWMTTPLTVSFVCADDSGSAVCPPPISVGEGAAQLIVGTAVDPAGHRTTASITVNVDLTPPSVTLNTTLDRSKTTDTEVAVDGNAFDGVSGLAGVIRCNGDPVTIVQGAFTCLVSLRPGLNSITLQAGDAAGHVTAAGLTITRVGDSTTLALAPTSREMAVNESAKFSLVDNFGVQISGAAWSSSDDTIVSMSSDDPPVVTAIAPGTATIRASKNGLSGGATIAVSAAALSPGTLRWTVAPTPGAQMDYPIIANRVDVEVPDIFIVETQTWGEAIIRGATSDGQVWWRQESPGIPLLGDSFGGVIAGVLYDVNQGDDFRAFVRLGNAGGVPPWRYDSPGSLWRPAQAEDGTIYAIEMMAGGFTEDGDAIWDKHVVTLDGRNGRLISRLRLEREVEIFTSAFDGLVVSEKPLLVCSHARHEYPPETVGPVVGDDGRGYLLVRQQLRRKWDSCNEQISVSPQRKIEQSIELFTLSPSAEPSRVAMYANYCESPGGGILVCDAPPLLKQIVPDGVGGMLMAWERVNEIVAGVARAQKSITRRSEDGQWTELPVARSTVIDSVGQDGVAYLHTPDGVSAVDVTQWKSRWTRDLGRFAPLAAHPGGGAAVLDYWTGDYRTVDSEGQLEAGTELRFLPRTWPVQEFSGWLGVSPAGLQSIVGEFPDATRWYPALGNHSNQLVPRRPGRGVFLKSHPVVDTLGVEIQHLSLRIVPGNQAWLLNRPTLIGGTDEFGNKYFTIGAGTGEGDTSTTCTGTLTKGINRLADVVLFPTKLRRIPVWGDLVEGAAIIALLQRYEGYADNLPYACNPEAWAGFYNSNSFAHGILHAAAIGHEEAPLGLVPGWTKPVPPHYFFFSHP